MGQVKKALHDAECNGHVHPALLLSLRAFLANHDATAEPTSDPLPDPTPRSANQPTLPKQLLQPQAQTVYGLYANGCLLALYQHKVTAEYECWVSRVGEEVSHAETLTCYEVQPIPMYTHIAK